MVIDGENYIKMFLGEYQLNFSGQGRIVLPAKFRGELDSKKEIILSRGLDGCIWGFSKLVWDKEAARQLEIPVTDQEGRNLRRYLFSAAEKINLDDQGRFVIPKNLMEYSQLEEEVIVVGAGDHFEVWNPQKWQGIVNNFTSLKNE